MRKQSKNQNHAASKKTGAPRLTDKQKRFIREYLIDLNATQAAIRAGYSAKTACSQGSRLLESASIKKALAEAKNARVKRTEITQDYVLKKLKRIVERCTVMGKDFKPRAAVAALNLMGKHLGMFTEKHEHYHSGDVGLKLSPELQATVDQIVSKSK